MIYLNILGRTRAQHQRVEKKLLRQGSLWGTISILEIFNIPFWKYYIRGLIVYLYNKTDNYIVDKKLLY